MIHRNEGACFRPASAACLPDHRDPALISHTLAEMLRFRMLALRDAIPAANPMARAEFATLRLRLLKVGARIVEKAARIRVHLASAGRLATAGP